MKLKKYAYLHSKLIGNYTLEIMKNTWKFTKKPGKIMEISWNFVSPEKWEPFNIFSSTQQYYCVLVK